MPQKVPIQKSLFLRRQKDTQHSTPSRHVSPQQLSLDLSFLLLFVRCTNMTNMTKIVRRVLVLILVIAGINAFATTTAFPKCHVMTCTRLFVSIHNQKTCCSACEFLVWLLSKIVVGIIHAVNCGRSDGGDEGRHESKGNGQG